MHRSHSISDISSFNMVSMLSFDPIRVRVLYVEEPQLRCISSGKGIVILDKNCFVTIKSTSLKLYAVTYFVTCHPWVLGHGWC